MITPSGWLRKNKQRLQTSDAKLKQDWYQVTIGGGHDGLGL
jgi:hypothetical protein